MNYTKETFDEKFGEEDYTVKFLYNFSNATDTERAGKVNKDVGTFKYAVQLYLDGEEVNEVEAKDFADVKVVNAVEAVSIEKVVLDNERNYLTKDETGVGFKVTEAKNALGEDLDEDSLEALSDKLKKVVSDDVTVAYVDGTTITARKPGSVSFDLTYYDGDDSITVKLPVEVKETGVATTLEAENQKVVAGTLKEDLDFKVFDQHGVELGFKSGYDVNIKDVDGENADLSEKGVYTVEIVPTGKDNTIGSFTVTVVDVEDADYDEFFFEEVEKDDNLDLDVDNENLTKDLKLKGIKDGVTIDAKDINLVSAKDADGYHIVVDEKVFIPIETLESDAKFTVKLADVKKATTSTIKLTHKQGDLVQELAEIELEIQNSTTQIDNLALAEGVKTLDVIEGEEGWNVDNPEQLVSSDLERDEKIAAKHIAKVEFSSNDGKAIVTIKDIYGGKEFVFDAARKLATAPETDITELTFSNTPDSIDNLLFFVDGITEPAWNPETGQWDHETKTREKAVTLDEVVAFFEGKGADFNTDALILEGSALTFVDGEVLLSAEDYTKMKTTAEEPYRITVIQLDENGEVALGESNVRLKAGKIAMYEDGTSVFENIN